MSAWLRRSVRAPWEDSEKCARGLASEPPGADTVACVLGEAPTTHRGRTFRDITGCTRRPDVRPAGPRLVGDRRRPSPAPRDALLGRDASRGLRARLQRVHALLRDAA